MNDDSVSFEEGLFAGALALSAEERDAFLRRACGDDASMRERIDALLRWHDTREGVLDAPPVESGLLLAHALQAGAELPEPPRRIGHYKLLQRIGEGGCGVVYLAEQEEPVHRRVALKLIKAGMDTREMIARFNAERQALALMDHPGIAKVFDAGATNLGRPYFVMEFVRGIPITKYCNEHHLPTAARLALFVRVCEAVQHAHQKGVIHRDLKPSNILITSEGAAAAPKIIDFGIAKATQGRLTDATLVTAFDQFIGTPVYMSPEQAELSVLDIDTRSDVYALGVVLYELLAGRPPFDPKTLSRSSRDEIRRVIREVEPARPSAHYLALPPADRIEVAKQHDTEPAKLVALFSGDLDWIAMKAMEKNRARRYDTPTALAEDITRHLNHEPVSARPPSAMYRVRKLVRRHRTGFTAAAVVGVVLLAGSVVSIWQAIRATQAEFVAELQRGRAVEERTKAENLLAFMLGDLREQLTRLGRLEVLEAVGDKSMAYFASLDTHDLSDEMLARHAQALRQIGELRMEQARYPEAERAYMEAYTRAAALTERNPRNADGLFERGQAEFGRGYVAWRRGELAAANEWLVRYRDTAAILVSLDPSDLRGRSELAYGQHNLALLDMERGQLDAARAGFLAVLATVRSLLTATPSDLELKFRIADATSYLATLAARSGDLAEAARLYGDQVAQLEELVAGDPGTAQWRFQLANALSFHSEVLAITAQRAQAQQQLARARELFEALVAQDEANRRWRQGLLVLHLDEAALARAAGDLDGALRLVETAREAYEQLAAAEPSDRRFAVRLVAALTKEAALLDAGDRPGAAAAAARAHERGEQLIVQGGVSATESADYARACLVVGRIAARHGDEQAAQRYWERAYEVLSPRLAKTSDWRLLDPAVRLMMRLKRVDDLPPLLVRLERMGYVPLEAWPDNEPSVFARLETPPNQGEPAR